MRFRVVAALLTVAFLGMGYKAYGLQIERGSHYRELAARQHLRTVEIPAPRGTIYDGAGKELAVNADVPSVWANPREVVDVAGTAAALAEVLAVDVREVEARLASTRYFVWIERHVTPSEAARVEALGLPGVSLSPEPRRFYPGGSLAGPVLGFAGIDGQGLDGLELEMNELLVGNAAERATLRDASGKLMVADPTARPQPGASIRLTIHRTIQFAAERALEDALRTHQAKAGVAVVMDVHTGDVLAMASLPTFDPNEPGDAREKGARNRAITDTFEIGSVMKIFTVAAALDAGVVEPSTVFDTENGRFRIGRKVIRDSYRDESLDVGGVIKRSSNVGAVKIARRLGGEALHAAFRRFGFGQRTDVELPGEQGGILRSWEDWSEIGLATHSFGYGMTASPLQVTAALAAVGNGGVYHPPRVVREVRGADGEVLYQRAPAERRVLGADTARALLPMLESVFDKGRKGGTAHALEVPGYRVGGKTGTAHKLDPETKTYSDDMYLSSFAGLAPIDDPQVAVLVLIDEPTGEHYYGAAVAGPAWAQLTAATLAYLGVPASEPVAPAPEEAPEEAPSPEPVVAVADSAEHPVDAGTSLVDELGREMIEIPDFAGMSMSRTIDVAREAGLEVTVAGSGRATHQYPPPGHARENTPVRVVFR